MKEYVYIKEINHLIKPGGIYNSFRDAKEDLESDITFYENMCKDFNFSFKFIADLPKSFNDNYTKYMKEYKFIHNAISESIIFCIYELEKKDHKNNKEPISEKYYQIVEQTRKNKADSYQSSSGYIEIGDKFDSIEEAKHFLYNRMESIKLDFSNKNYSASAYESDENNGHFLLSFYNNDIKEDINFDFEIRCYDKK